MELPGKPLLDDGTVGARIEGEIGWILLGGERAFTLDQAFPAAFEGAIDAVEAAGARAVVLAGTTKVFCAGADLRLAPRLQEPEFAKHWLEIQHGAIRKLVECPLPTVAAVHGAAAGAGCNLALGCDHVVTATRAGFSQAFIRIGLATDMGSLYLLPRRVGHQTAKELMLSGRTVGGAEAVEIGLADEAVETDEVWERSRTIAAARAAGPLAAYAAVKRGLDRGATDLCQSLDIEADLQLAVMAHPDFAEGSAAFLEKRPPRFGASG
jgi:2-(1,2-epoxy-1,2-dihydrophenyl)acetyl-CoA isomerase